MIQDRQGVSFDDDLSRYQVVLVVGTRTRYKCRFLVVVVVLRGQTR